MSSIADYDAVLLISVSDQSASLQASWCRLRVSPFPDAVDHLIRRQCRERLRPAHTGPDVAGRYSLVRIVGLCFALLYGQIQATTGQYARLIW